MAVILVQCSMFYTGKAFVPFVLFGCTVSYKWMNWMEHLCVYAMTAYFRGNVSVMFKN